MQQEEDDSIKVFKYCNDCSVSICSTPSGFGVFLVYIKGTPYFGIGSIYAQTALELTSCQFYFNDKRDLLLGDETLPVQEPSSDTYTDRLFKLRFYTDQTLNQYRVDLVQIAKTGDAELDARDPWKDFNDLKEATPGAPSLTMAKRYLETLKDSRNEPNIIITCDILGNQVPLENTVGIVHFRKMQ